MKGSDGVPTSGATWTARDMTPHASLLVDTYFTTPEPLRGHALPLAGRPGGLGVPRDQGDRPYL
ncbi:MAG: hypothetical protein ACRDJF_02065, partial [Actinomycetota bacterium]